jgi:hypothetical protein
MLHAVASAYRHALEVSRGPAGTPHHHAFCLARSATQLYVLDEEIGLRLANFAKFKGVQPEFSIVKCASPMSPPEKQAALCQRRGAHAVQPAVACVVRIA